MTITDVSALVEELRAKGIDVIRVSLPDLIGVDRGRDVLIEELESTVEHGIAFCRAVYHTSPMGDVVPVQGGIESGARRPLVPGGHHGPRWRRRGGVPPRGGAARR
jgi:hypothetical protein